jgi:hypothetical protein
VCDVGAGVGHGLDGFCEFADRDAVTGADVERVTDGVIVRRGKEVRLDNVVDVDEVPARSPSPSTVMSSSASG